MESIIKDYIVEQLHNSGSLLKNQHDLLTAFELWTSWIDAGFGVDIVYLDYRKASGSVVHVTLIEKLLCDNNINCKLIMDCSISPG